MFCDNCGARLNDNIKFCPECGTKVNQDNFLLLEQKKADVFSAYSKNIKANIEKPKPKANDKKAKIGKTFLAFGVLLLVMGVVLYFLNSNRYDGKRTIMIYMVGSDLESNYYAASSDINEMLTSNFDDENINLLIYTGGSKKWHTDVISSDENAIYRVKKTGLEKLESYSRTSMGDPSTLVDFINYAYKNYKAEKYSLILWDHGGGPIYGYGYDEYNKLDSLTLIELKDALEHSPFSDGKKLEFLGFDACLMASAEVAFTVSPYADYLIASQEVEPGNGWNYSFLGTIQKDSNVTDIGKNIIDSYSDYYSKKIDGRGISLSMIKLNKMAQFEERLNDLFSIMDQNLRLDYSKISRSRSGTKTFGKATAVNYDLVDLYDLIDKLPDEYYTKVNALKSALDDLIVYQKTDIWATNGLSIYFPYENKTRINDIIYLYKKFNFASDYTEFIDNFTATLTGKRIFTGNVDDAEVQSSAGGVVTVTIPEELSANYSDASYVIFEKLDDGYYMPRYKGTDVKLENNTLSTTITKKALVATSSDGEEIYVTALEGDKGTDYVKYLIPGTLQNWGDDFISDFTMLPIYLELVVDSKNPNGKITGAKEITDSDTNVSPKSSIELKDWKVLQLLNMRYKIFDANGNYTTNWESSGVITGFETELDKDFSIEFKDLDIEKEYYVLFKVADTQGNIYTTNLAKVKN